jgi:transposase
VRHDDVRDARHLARLLHLGEIVEVAVPSEELEAARVLTRARESARRDLMSARHLLLKLLRHGVVYAGGRPWTSRHGQWLRAQRLPMLHSQLAISLYPESARSPAHIWTRHRLTAMTAYT